MNNDVDVLSSQPVPSDRPALTKGQQAAGHDVIPVAFDSVYTWTYGVQRQDLRHLYEK